MALWEGPGGGSLSFSAFEPEFVRPAPPQLPVPGVCQCANSVLIVYCLLVTMFIGIQHVPRQCIRRKPVLLVVVAAVAVVLAAAVVCVALRVSCLSASVASSVLCKSH
jgi:hypothetical protein